MYMHMYMYMCMYEAECRADATSRVGCAQFHTHTEVQNLNLGQDTPHTRAGANHEPDTPRAVHHSSLESPF